MITAHEGQVCAAIGNEGFRLNPGHLLPEEIRNRLRGRIMERETVIIHEALYPARLDSGFKNVSCEPLSQIDGLFEDVPLIKTYAPTMTIFVR